MGKVHWIPEDSDAHEAFVDSLGTNKGQEVANKHGDATARKRDQRQGGGDNKKKK